MGWMHGQNSIVGLCAYVTLCIDEQRHACVRRILIRCVSSSGTRHLPSYWVATATNVLVTVTNSAVRRVDGVCVCMRKEHETRYDGIGR